MNTDNGKPDQQQGLYRKYDVKRVSDPTGKHKDCSYYVFDLDHDKHAVAALLAYAESCKAEFPTLAFDLQHTAAATARKLDVAPLPECGTITCEKCCFRYGAEHTLADGTYKCPVCELDELRSASALSGATPPAFKDFYLNRGEGGGDTARRYYLAEEVDAWCTQIANKCTQSGYARSTSGDNLAASLAVKLAKAASLLTECVEGTVVDCTDWNRRTREFLQDAPSSASGALPK